MNALLLAMLLAVVAGSPGCLPKAKAQTVTTPGGVAINTRALRMRLYELTARLASEAESASNRIQAECDDPEIYRNALLFKTELIPAIHRASFRPDPLLSAIDVGLLTVCSARSSRSPWTRCVAWMPSSTPSWSYTSSRRTTRPTARSRPLPVSTRSDRGRSAVARRLSPR
jgi:hypothetical protein